MAKTALYLTFLFGLINSVALGGSPPDAIIGQPLHIKYGIYLIDLNVDFKESTFDADFYWWFKYDTSIANAKNMTDANIFSFEFTNCENCPPEIIKDSVQSKTYEGIRYLTGRTRGKYHFEPDYTNYPFDSQTLTMEFEHKVADIDSIFIDIDETSYPASNHDNGKFWLSDEVQKDKSKVYDIKFCTAVNTSHIYRSNFGDPEFKDYPNASYSRGVHSIVIQRYSFSHVLKIIFPLLIIILFVNTVFYVPPARIEVASSVGSISLLGALAFQLLCSEDLPSIGYMVFSDWVFYLTYFFIFLAILQSILTYYWEPDSENKNPDDLEPHINKTEERNYKTKVNDWEKNNHLQILIHSVFILKFTSQKFFIFKNYLSNNLKIVKYWVSVDKATLSSDLEIGARRYFVLSYIFFSIYLYIMMVIFPWWLSIPFTAFLLIWIWAGINSFIDKAKITSSEVQSSQSC